MVTPAIRVAPNVSSRTEPSFLPQSSHHTISQAAKRASSLLRTIQYTHPPSCPCHSNPGYHQQNPSSSLLSHVQRRFAGTPVAAEQKEYAFEMAASSIRFGPGVTKEVGMDFKNLGSKKVCVVTDSTVDKLDAMKQVREGLTREGVNFEVFSNVRVEPKDSSYGLDIHSIESFIFY
jgi:hydroxyacid-oxoacid transhydrogenase